MRTFEINLGELHLTRLAYQKQIEKLTQHKEKLSSLADKLSTMWEGKVATQFIQNMQIFLAVEYNSLLDDYREIAKKLEEAEELFVPLLSLCEGFPDIIKHGNSIGHTISGAAPSPDDILSLDEASGLEINEGIQEYSRQLTKINTLWNQAHSSSSGLSRSSFRLSNYEATFAEGTQRQGKAVSDFFDAFSFNYVPALKEADEKVANSLTNLFETVYYTSMASQSNNLAEVRGFFPAELQEILTIKQQQIYALNLTNMLKYLTEEEIEQIKAGGHPQTIFEKKDPEIQIIYNEFQNQTMEMLSKEQRADLSFLSSILIQILPISQKKAILDKLKTQDGKISLEDLDEIQKLHPSYVEASGPSIDSLLETEYKMNQNHFSFREAEEAKWNEHRAQLNALMMWSSIRLVNNIQTTSTQAILYGDNRLDKMELDSFNRMGNYEYNPLPPGAATDYAEFVKERETYEDWFSRMPKDDQIRYEYRQNNPGRPVPSVEDVSNPNIFNEDKGMYVEDYVAEPSLPLGGKPLGEYEEEVDRGIVRQNQSADTLADRGYDVTMLKREDYGGNGYGIKDSTNPDFYIEGKVFDCYSPDSNKIKVIREGINGKVGVQANNIVLNLDDSKLTPEKVISAFTNEPIIGLEELIIIKDGEMTQKFFKITS